jgi:phospholipid/cholesterol/gamma-HCH transport system substrate-binding protein
MRRVRRSGMTPIAAGAIALVVAVILVYAGFTKTNPFHSAMEVKAAFKTVNDLKKGSAVRVAGVNVGKVKKVESVTGGKRGEGAIVTMEIEDAGLPLHEDMTMKIRPRIFLEGNWFVDVQPGSPSAPVVEEGYLVPVQQTAAPVQFGQVLTALQSDTREDLQVVLDEYGKALCGEDLTKRCKSAGAAGYNRSIRYWEPAFRDSAIVNDAMLGKLEHDLSNYIKGADRFARGINRDPRALKALVVDLATTAQAFASEEQNLSDAIHELPLTLSAGRRALGELNDAFPPLRRLVADMRPAVRAAGPALDVQYPLIRQLRGLVSDAELKGLVRDLKPTVPSLVELNEGGVDLQKELRLLSSCSNNVIVPWRNDTVPDKQFPASGKVFQEQVKWMPGIAAESRGFDANGQFVKSLANGAEYAYPLNDGRYFVTGLPLQGVNPPKAAAPPFRADAPCETQQPPDLRSTPEAPPAAKKVNFEHPQVQAAMVKEQAQAVKWLREELKRTGDDIPVLDDLLSAGQIPLLEKVPR